MIPYYDSTPQFKILTSHIAYDHPEKGLCINPFYKAPYLFVEQNLEKAKDVYEHIFKQFIGTWSTLYSTGEFHERPPKHWEDFKL